MRTARRPAPAGLLADAALIDGLLVTGARIELADGRVVPLPPVRLRDLDRAAAAAIRNAAGDADGGPITPYATTANH